MKDYTFSEIGMLVGAALGGILSVACFSTFGNILFFGIAVLGLFSGLTIGGAIDRRQKGKRKEAEE